MNKKDYLELVERRKNEQIENGAFVTLSMPSGATWKVLPLRTGQYAVSGKMPLHLMAGLKSLKEVNQKELEAKLTGDDMLKMLEMVSHVFLNNVVEPRITLEETDDSITPEMVDPADFEFFRDWVISGGQSMRGKSRNSPVK